MQKCLKCQLMEALLGQNFLLVDLRGKIQILSQGGGGDKKIELNRNNFFILLYFPENYRRRVCKSTNKKFFA